MLEAKLLRSDITTVAAQLARRGFELDVAAFTAIEERRKAATLEVERLRNERNVRSKDIGKAKAQGQDVAPLLAEVENLGAQMKAAEEAFAAAQTAFDEWYQEQRIAAEDAGDISIDGSVYDAASTAQGG